MSVIDEMKRRRDQVALEADKMLRINRKQGEIGQWRKQVEQTVVQLGNAVYGLHTQGSALPPELTPVCQQIDALYAQIQQGELEVERIRQEALPEAALATGPRCLVCGSGIPDVAAFCPNCGSPRPKPQPAMACTNCGSSLAADARFCASCGQPVALPSPEAEVEPADTQAPPATMLCSGCQAEIDAQAVFCPLCGTPVADATA